MDSRGIARAVEAARARLIRLTPGNACAAVEVGALLVDTRPEYQRRADGDIPGAIVIERNQLEWRLDPLSRSSVAISRRVLEWPPTTRAHARQALTSSG